MQLETGCIALVRLTPGGLGRLAAYLWPKAWRRIVAWHSNNCRQLPNDKVAAPFQSETSMLKGW